MWTKKFWLDTAERLIRTAAQAAVGAIGTTAVIQEVDWAVVGGTTAVATVLAFFMALAAPGVSDDPTTASFVD